MFQPRCTATGAAFTGMTDREITNRQHGQPTIFAQQPLSQENSTCALAQSHYDLGLVRRQFRPESFDRIGPATYNNTVLVPDGDLEATFIGKTEQFGGVHSSISISSSEIAVPTSVSIFLGSFFSLSPPVLIVLVCSWLVLVPWREHPK